ncbi:TrwC protein [gamma proteobacterium BDW918]|jgi:conjugative relaxase-like TrwC/TraI family protein|uniref:Multifunctional conjugation protein TraI n=1 Tax=Zhongshania aliphaticivorans TaxID=1470434 RepID=A0A127M9Z4_9GAMM|nr:MobF family relaxase [Zhongshania aliphaticivorans]AMO70064.1 hypothetical protein AZF00_17925 [Zhongshania aliphaticivorans]EIF41747.1 TrwC protein [gamma proteobacterium BDW918]|tara:strand:+ start:11120 stop:13912 length:2793 start_codon:yes stop_codon:yes gene_type:complete
MTCNPTAIRSAPYAARYLLNQDHANYYLEDESCHSFWAGDGARRLGIEGSAVEVDRLIRYLHGNIAGEELGRFRAGKREHKAGIDFTTSPPKSVSLVALVGRDERALTADQESIKEMISFITKMAAYTRSHKRFPDGTESFDNIPADNLLCAVFRHETSRSLDPLQHHHVVILNASQTAEGNWRSIQTRPFFDIQKAAGLFYRQTLASKLRVLGYEISKGRDGNFEIAGFSNEQLRVFSQRSNEIEKTLSEQGLTREKASPALKEKVSHDTRSPKAKTSDRDELVKEWQLRSREFGCDIDQIVGQSRQKSQSKSWQRQDRIDQTETIYDLIRNTILSISERDSVFSKNRLRDELNFQAVGYGISTEQVCKGIEWAERESLLVGGYRCAEYRRSSKSWQQVEAFTTPETIKLEEGMIRTARCMRLNATPVLTIRNAEAWLAQAERKNLSDGFDGWTADQKTAVRGLLTTKDQLVAVQGYAGTAKTSTALRLVADVYKHQGYLVRGMAPSVSACTSLSEGAELKNVVTVASHLIKTDHNNSLAKPEVWLVDEASLISTRDMAKLIGKAHRCKARLVLVGDMYQLGSVDAGAAFRQIQESGITTLKLEEIVRQKDISLLDAVNHSVKGQAVEALNMLSKGNSQIIEISGGVKMRHKALAERYLALPIDERQKTLIIEPSRNGRQHLTSAIRAGLKELGDLSKQESNATSFSRIDMTTTSAKDILNYSVGDTVKFCRGYKRKGIEKNSYWTIQTLNPELNVATLTGENGEKVMWNPASWGGRSQVYSSLEAGLSRGDRIIWTTNNRESGLSNGTRAEVISINDGTRTAMIRLESGRELSLHLNSARCYHWTHDYVSTVHAAQGKTCERVFYHAESYRTNLSSQKALYVSLSRARQEAVLVTDSRQLLEQQLQAHSGEKQNASQHIDQHALDYSH